jgi:ABC-type transport system substrate-binding protein
MTTMGTYAHWWICQMGKEPLDDPEVRKALRHCFDIEAINNAAFKGKGLEHSWNPFNLYPNSSGLDADVDYDPAKTKQILADLGKSGHLGAAPVHRGLPGRHRRRTGDPAVVRGRPASPLRSRSSGGDWLERTYTNGTGRVSRSTRATCRRPPRTSTTTS